VDGMEQNIKLLIEYDGTGFSGWQYQPGLKTVQGELQKALEKLTGKRITLYGAGRTDAGVHALGQAAHFKIDHNLPVEKYRDGLNFYLPDKIRIRRAETASPGFHARYSAVYRKYIYIISRRPSPLERNRSWEMTFPLDIQLLNAAAEYILGEHDFTTCCVVSSQKKNNRCLVYASRWREGNERLYYEIMADRFLHSMIRSLVGLMVETARGAITPARFRQIMKAGDHTAIGRVAPAQGLYLVEIGY